MATKRKSSPAGKAGQQGSAPSVRIRMYRVGFGDCFLVTLKGVHHILVDCGVHNKGNIKVNGDSLIDKAFENIEQVTNKKLDIVIATHAHQDHVSGFGKFVEGFESFDINEVWLPWTDDLSNPTAKKWHAKKKALVSLLLNHLNANLDARAVAAAENAGANPVAMTALRHGFGKAKVRYLKANDELDAPAGLTGFSAKILGPPLDQSFIAKMDPPGSDHYLRMAAAVGVADKLDPFPGLGLSEADRATLAKDWLHLDAGLLEHIADQAKFPARAVAFSLDKLLNNTSIVALFTWAGKHLFFPGDAQYGDWISWYKGSGSSILSDISFYKVAHHGSWNATPRGAVEEMPEGDFAAMMSTQSVPWASIPRPALAEALDKRTGGAMVRSDSLPVMGAPSGPKLGPLPRSFVAGDSSAGEHWIDYNIS